MSLILWSGLKGTGIQRRVVIGIVVARYIILPLSGILIVKGAIQVGFVPPNNKLFVFLLLLQHAMPPAMNLGNVVKHFLHLIICFKISILLVASNFLLILTINIDKGYVCLTMFVLCLNVLGTMMQLFGAGKSECSVIMLWTYASAPVFLTLWSTIFLWIVT